MSDIVIYEDGTVALETTVENESVWLTQQQISELFGVQRPAITKHLSNIFKSGELDEKVVCSILEHTTQHGAVKGKLQAKKTKLYNLDAIISLGYRVNSQRATKFRIWATRVLKEYLINGYVLNQEKLRQKKLEELDKTLELIRSSIESKELEANEAKGESVQNSVSATIGNINATPLNIYPTSLQRRLPVGTRSKTSSR